MRNCFLLQNEEKKKCFAKVSLEIDNTGKESEEGNN